MNIRSHLVFEIGTLNTRVGYFEEVGAKLRFINATLEPSTHLAPEKDVMLGVIRAIKTIETKIDKRLLRNDSIITPENVNGEGADEVIGLYSFGSPISTLVVDLARKDNTDAIREIAARNNMRIVDGVSDKDIQNYAFMLNVIEESAIEMILMWVDDSSDQSKIEKVIDVTQVAKDVFGPDGAPTLLVIGDQRKIRQVIHSYQNQVEQNLVVVPITTSGDRFTAIDTTIHRINEARLLRLNPSLLKINGWVKNGLAYSDHYAEKFVRLVAGKLPSTTNILHIDVGASSILITGRVNDVFAREKFDQFGVGAKFVKALSVIKIPVLMKRGVFLSEDKLRNYIFSRTLHPEYIPDRSEELMIHYEVARAMLRSAFDTFYSHNFPSKTKNRREIAIDRIYLSGEVFTNAPRFHYLARLVMEGMKLPAEAEIYLDKFNMISMIGAITNDDAEIIDRIDLGGCVIPLFIVLPVQSTELDDTLILKCGFTDHEGEQIIDVAKGDVCRIELNQPNSVKLNLQPIGHTDVGSGRGTPREIVIPEEFKTLLIDARERPIELPAKVEDRKNTITRWQVSLGETS